MRQPQRVGLPAEQEGDSWGGEELIESPEGGHAQVLAGKIWPMRSRVWKKETKNLLLLSRTFEKFKSEICDSYCDGCGHFKNTCAFKFNLT